MRIFKLFVPEKFTHLVLDVPSRYLISKDIDETDYIIEGYLPDKGFELFIKVLNIRHYVKTKNLFSVLSKYSFLLQNRSSKETRSLYHFYKQKNLNNILSAIFHSRNSFEFISSLFKAPYFNSFNVIHLFIHQKGSKQVKHHEVQINNLKSHDIPVSDFNELFHAIKKSKNRSFGQENLKGTSYNIIGTCIGHEMSLDQHNAIIVITKNDFLPQTQEDIQLFNELVPLISFGLNYQLMLFFYKNNNDLANKSLLSLSTKSDSKNTISHEQLSESFDIEHKQRISLLGELLNTLKHELSNPLFGMKLITDLLLLEDFDDENQEFINE